MTNPAAEWFKGGMSVVPIKADGTKKPVGAWKHLQARRMSAFEVARTWGDGSNGLGVGVICGQVSGNLEMTELEGEVTSGQDFEILMDCLDRWDVRALWDEFFASGYAELSPGGGLHLLYRVDGPAVPGNTKLAIIPGAGANGSDVTLAETRGEGGYVIVAPTGRQCSDPVDEAPWATLAGEPGQVPVITWGQRERLHSAISEAFDQRSDDQRARDVKDWSDQPVTPKDPIRPAEDRPGDRFNREATWESILEPHGWTVAGPGAAGETLLCRPGKDRRQGHSAAIGYMGDLRMWVWSSSAGLETERYLSKFWVYAHYEHGGDLKAAAKAIAAQYGMPARRPDGGIGDGIIMSARPVDVDADMVVDVGGDARVTDVAGTPLMYYRHTDMGNSERLLAFAGDQHRYVAERKKWFWYTGTQWEADLGSLNSQWAVMSLWKKLRVEADESGDEKFQKFVMRCESYRQTMSALNMWAAHPGSHIKASEFDADKDLINCRNGIVNARTGEFLDHDPKYLLSKQMRANFNPDATAPRWDAFLETNLPDPDLRRYLQKMIGYTLLGNPVEKALAILSGPFHTGKSKFIEAMAHVFGSYAGTAAAKVLSYEGKGNAGPSNDLNDLRGKRLVTTSEASQDARLDEELIKRLTGLDSVTSRALYEENSTWNPECVIWMATNHHPRITSDDGATWSRIKVVRWEKQFMPGDPARDVHLLEKLIAEADGILNWILEGVRLYLAEGLSQPEKVTAAVEAYKFEQNLVAQFLEAMVDDDNIDRDDAGEILKTQLFGMYEGWSQRNRHPVLGQMRFNRKLTEMGFEEFKRGRKYWRGLRQKIGEGGSILGTF